MKDGIAAQHGKGIAKRIKILLSYYSISFLTLTFLFVPPPSSFLWSRWWWYGLVFGLVMLHTCVYAHFLAYQNLWHHSLIFSSVISTPGFIFMTAVMWSMPIFTAIKVLSGLSTALPHNIASFISLNSSAFFSHPNMEILLVVVFSSLLTVFIVFQAYSSSWEVVHLPFTRESFKSVTRLDYHREPLSKFKKDEKENSKIKICQISDPHIGIFMTPQSLHKLCSEVVQLEPDFVFITGDMFAVEMGHGDPMISTLVHALSPLKCLKGSCFACLGNHDYSCLKYVKKAFKELGITLLCDENVFLEHKGHKFEIIGAHFIFSVRRTLLHLAELCQKFPPPENSEQLVRLMLVHDPSGVTAIPHDHHLFCFSGHIHGGQIGLQSFGLNFTLARFLFNICDHGLWAHHTNRMFVHRGNGQHAFPFRVGVSREKSLAILDLPPNDNASQTPQQYKKEKSKTN